MNVEGYQGLPDWWVAGGADLEKVQEWGHSGSWKCDSHLVARTVCRMCHPYWDSPLPSIHACCLLEIHSLGSTTPLTSPGPWLPKAGRGNIWFFLLPKCGHWVLPTINTSLNGGFIQRMVACVWTAPKMSPVGEGMHLYDILPIIVSKPLKDSFTLEPPLKTTLGTFFTFS